MANKVAPPYVLVSMNLVLLYVVLTVIFFIIMQIDKKTYFIYTFFKYFYLILFILWIHKYMSKRTKRMLAMNQDDDRPEEDFFRTQLNKLFA